MKGLTLIYGPTPATEAGRAAERMTMRPLPEDTDGGLWVAAYATPGDCAADCEVCRCFVTGPCIATRPSAGAVTVVCLPCAAATCQRAEDDARAAQAAHAAADPHCTCNDCIAALAAQVSK